MKSLMGRVALLSLLIGFAADAVIAGCGTTQPDNRQTWAMSTSPKLREAQGKMTVLQAQDGSHVVYLTFDGLPPASQAFVGAQLYMIWLLPKGGNPQSVGIISVDDELKASLTIKTPYEAFDVVISAEFEGNPTRPSGNRAFSGTVTPS
jgi:hypothetical protein